VQSLEAAHQHENEHDHQDESESAGRVIAPTGAIGPRRQRADKPRYNEPTPVIHFGASRLCWSISGFRARFVHQGKPLRKFTAMGEV
jgi:hypothetical protein